LYKVIVLGVFENMGEKPVDKCGIPALSSLSRSEMMKHTMIIQASLSDLHGKIKDERREMQSVQLIG